MIIRSIGMMTAINVCKGVITLLLSFYIAKAVSPAEFGLIAFAIPLAALITLLTDLGIANAVVRERSLSKAQAGSALVLMLTFGLVGGGLLALLAAPIEKISGLPGVLNVVLGFSLVACFSVWATCPRALIERELHYGLISAVELVAMLAGTLGFFLALDGGWGIFALVTFHVILQGIRSLIFLWCSRHLFEWVLIPRGIKQLLQTGGWIFASNLLSYASRNLDRFIISANLGAAAVGLYGFAYQFMTLPLVLLAWPASGVLMSSLSRLNDDDEGKKKVVEGFIALTAAAVFPMMALVAFQLDYPLRALLSATWEGVHSYIALLAPLGALQALAVYGTATFVADGKIKLSFKLSIANGTLIPAGFILSVPYGLMAAVITYICTSLTISGFVVFFMCKSAKISLIELTKLLAPGATAALLVFIVWWIPFSIFDSSTLNWIVSFSISATIAIAGLLLFHRTLVRAIQGLVATRISRSSLSTS